MDLAVEPPTIRTQRNTLSAGCLGPVLGLLWLWVSVGFVFASHAGKPCDDAMDAYWSGRYSDAVPLLSTAIQSGDCPSYFKIHLGVSQLHAGQIDSGDATLREFLAEYPGSARGWYYRGLIHFSRGQVEEAAAVFQRSIQIDSSEPDTHKMLARCFVLKQKQAEAERSLVRAMELNPRDYEVRYLLGRLYQSTDRLKEAVRFLDDSVRLNPGHARGHAYLGTVHFALGDEERAKESFQQALSANRRSRNPDFVPHFEYGAYLAKTGELEAGVRQLRTAVERGPNETACYFELARSLSRLGRKEEARKILERAVSIDHQEPKLHYLLGRICYELGDEECGQTHTTLSEMLRQ